MSRLSYFIGSGAMPSGCSPVISLNWMYERVMRRFDPLAMPSVSIEAEMLESVIGKLDGDILVQADPSKARIWLYLARTALLESGYVLSWHYLHPDIEKLTVFERGLLEISEQLALLLADRVFVSCRSEFDRLKKLDEDANLVFIDSLSISAIPLESGVRRRSGKSVSRLIESVLEKDCITIDEAARKRAFFFKQRDATYRALGRCLDDGMGRIAIYGAGRHTREKVDMLKIAPVEVVAILDDDADKVPADIYPWPVMLPEEVSSIDVDAILISSAEHETKMWSRREIFENRGLRVYTIYQGDTYEG